MTSLLTPTVALRPSFKDVSSQPLVSIVIPAYNAAAFIDRTLWSIRNQRYKNLDIIVVDDGSYDHTADIVSAIAQKDDRIRLLQQANRGVAAARNLGISHARGEFVAPIDADDVWHPDAVAKLVTQFRKSSSRVGVVYAWSIDIDEHDRPTGGFHASVTSNDVYRTLICHNFLGNASSTLIRKDCLDQIGGYDIELREQNAQGCEDWDLYLRLAERYHFKAVSEFLVGYRKSVAGMSCDFSQMARSQQLMLKKVQQRHTSLPDFLFRLSQSSFYLYLAQQCDFNQNSENALFWLSRAFRVDPVTPIGRLGFYWLLLKNLIKTSWKQAPVPTIAITTAKRRNLRSAPITTWFEGASSKFKPQSGRLQVWLKIAVGELLHRFLFVVSRIKFEL